MNVMYRRRFPRVWYILAFALIWAFPVVGGGAALLDSEGEIGRVLAAWPLLLVWVMFPGLELTLLWLVALLIHRGQWQRKNAVRS